MSFLGYPEYKNAHTDFLGNVPTHWNVERLKHCAEVFPSNVDKKSVDGQIPVRLCNYTDVYYNEVIQHDSAFMQATATKDQVKRFELQKGDVVFTKDSENVDDIAIAAYVPKSMPSVIYGYHLSIARPKGSVVGKFLKRFFDSQETKSYFAVSANGLTRVGLGQYAVDNAPIALPPLEEQRAIATFLDHETARIDALVEEQQHLIELLKEKRLAVISHAVTKGLDPDVLMKDSGVEWLGEVPAHWDMVALRRVLQRIEQGWSPECFNFPADEGKWGVLKAGAVNNGVYREADNKALPEGLEPRSNLEVVAGDLLMCRASGSPELIGSAAYVETTRAMLMLSDKLFRLVVNSIALPEFIALALGSISLRRQIEESINGAEGLANNLSQASIKSLKLVLPPMQEQRQIVSKVAVVINNLEEQLALAANTVELLQERRSALISAAVTGKIDVRSWQAERETEPSEMLMAAEERATYG